MGLLREDTEFGSAIDQASSRLQLARAFVEKDYWVTQVLYALHLLHPGGFLLKGGTSLSKGYGIIDRFSEDVDILVVRHAAHSATSAEQRLLGMTTGVAGSLGLEWEEARPPGRGKDASRGDYLNYRGSDSDPGLGLPIRPDAVLLETGYAGGPEPSEMCTVSTLVGEALGLSPAEYEDVAPFELRMLEPSRTLIEKCFALHHLASNFSPDNPPMEVRFGRHYYDVYRLLDDARTTDRLADRDGFNRVVEDVERISSTHFVGVTSRPADGFSVSPAFRPERGSPLRAWLEDNYETALSLLPSSSGRPSFGQVLARVEERAALL